MHGMPDMSKESNIARGYFRRNGFERCFSIVRCQQEIAGQNSFKLCSQHAGCPVDAIITNLFESQA